MTSPSDWRKRGEAWPVSRGWLTPAARRPRPAPSGGVLASHGGAVTSESGARPRRAGRLGCRVPAFPLPVRSRSAPGPLPLPLCRHRPQVRPARPPQAPALPWPRRRRGSGRSRFAGPGRAAAAAAGLTLGPGAGAGIPPGGAGCAGVGTAGRNTVPGEIGVPGSGRGPGVCAGRAELRPQSGEGPAGTCRDIPGQRRQGFPRARRRCLHQRQRELRKISGFPVFSPILSLLSLPFSPPPFSSRPFLLPASFSLARPLLFLLLSFFLLS